MLQLFRVLLPSWKFFDRPTAAPELYYREIIAQARGEIASREAYWQLCIPKAGARSLKQLFLNPRESFLFASHALLEYFRNDLEAGEDLTTSLKLLQNLVRYHAPSAQKLQLRVAYSLAPQDELYTSEIFVGGSK